MESVAFPVPPFIGASVAFVIGLSGFAFFLNSPAKPLLTDAQEIASASQSFPLPAFGALVTAFTCLCRTLRRSCPA